MTPDLTQRLLSWYTDQRRDLPWRRSTDPYAIWVAEVMLQQTRVQTVIPYYLRWMQTFPNVQALASAETEQVLQAWEGLGYYRRAHGLHQAARQIVANYNGRLPSSADELRQLPGIGPYTAAAIASIAFGQDEIALDGNLRRVLSRLFDISLPLGAPASEAAFRQRAAGLLPGGRAGKFNQALMDLGSLVCTPATPNCGGCPLRLDCLAYQRGVQTRRPVRPAKASLPHVQRVAAVIERQGRYLVGRRPQGALLGGLWEFPGTDLGDKESADRGLARMLSASLGLELIRASRRGSYRHSYTHFRVTAHAFHCQIAGGPPASNLHDELRWLQADELAQVPMGKIDRQIATAISA